MTYTIEKKEVSVEVTLNITTEEWAKHCDEAFNKNKGKYSVPGFRKGHVPRRILENMYGKEFLYDEALDLCFGNYYGEALDSDKSVEVLSYPTLNEFNVQEDGSVVVKAEAPVKPEVKLGAYTGLEIVKTDATVTEEEVEAELKRTLDKYAGMVNIEDRPVEDGDTVTIDYSGSVDGVAFEGGTAENQKLVIGSNTFIPGFEPQLIGMNVGEEKDINVKFPEEYHAEELKGKDSVFHIKLHKIEKKEVPELTDEFAADISEFDSKEAYIDDIRKRMTENKQKRAETLDENKLVDLITANAEVPESRFLIEREMDYYLGDFERMLNGQGITMDQYAKYTNQTKEQIRETNRERAVIEVKTQLVIDAVIEKENLTATEEQKQAMLESHAKEAGKDVEAYKAELPAEATGYIARQATVKNFFDFVKSHNSFVEGKEEAAAETAEQAKDAE